MSGDSQKLLELAERVEKAEGPDRELDGEIAMTVMPYLAVLPRRENGGWIHPELGRIAPASCYTASLDAALTLVPEGWYWRCGKTTSFQAWAVVNRTHPDHCEPNRDEFFANREHWKTEKWTPVLALCAAALRARAAI